MTPARYFIINKPYNMLSQFVSEKPAVLLGDTSFDFPEGIHAVGRLDKHSEGLLILTTNKRVTKLLFQGEVVHKRTYLVKVKNKVTPERLQQLRSGIALRGKGGETYITTACEAFVADDSIHLSKLPVLPVDHHPHTWLVITITEGKYRQVRKMVKAIHHSCQRLIRISIEDMQLDGLVPGAVREIEESIFFRLLKINHWQMAAEQSPDFITCL